MIIIEGKKNELFALKEDLTNQHVPHLTDLAENAQKVYFLPLKDEPSARLNIDVLVIPLGSLGKFHLRGTYSITTVLTT